MGTTTVGVVDPWIDRMASVDFVGRLTGLWLTYHIVPSDAPLNSPPSSSQVSHGALGHPRKYVSPSLPVQPNKTPNACKYPKMPPSYTDRHHSNTHAVNIAGSFVLGALSVSSSLDPRLKLVAGTGMCGALTTFSTFSVDTVHCPILGMGRFFFRFLFVASIWCFIYRGMGRDRWRMDRANASPSPLPSSNPRLPFTHNT